MMLRLEVQLFLWVTALAFVGLTIFHGSPPAAPLLSDAGETDSVANAPSILVHIDQVAETLPDDDRLGSGSRPIFPMPVVIAAPQGDPVIAQVNVLPILKGIISSDMEQRAIFASGTEAYLVVGLGDAVAGFTVVEISSKHLLARDRNGVEQVFALRGSGEN